MLLQNSAATVTVILGLLSLLMPSRVSEILGFKTHSGLGLSEFRATYGGFFIALGIGCLLSQSTLVFGVLGAAWCSASIVRIASAIVDKSHSWQNIAGIVFEATVGMSMITVHF
jgi:hypothetical protein